MRALAAGALVLCCLTASRAQSLRIAPFLSYEQALPVFTALGETPPAATGWNSWIAAADASTRARVRQGDESSIVNLILFGTSFTNRPRITAQQLTTEQLRAAVSTRLDDFERALAAPGANERLLYARSVLSGSAPVRIQLLSMIERTVKEGETLARLTVEAERAGDPSLQFAERSRLYRGRGLASDTSLRVNLAVEEALRRAYPKGAPRLRRVAIIGPGLDVVDKEAGHDFYPPQTLQPFAVIDSLIRLGFADEETIQLTTLDVSARVNGHIAEIGLKARAGSPYLVHTPLDGEVAWTPQTLAYFAAFGEKIGRPVPVSIPPGVGRLRFRAISIRPSIAARVSAQDVNITAQFLPLGDAERFDLIIGTNIFVYYDRLEQARAMVNIASMLRPGAMLLSNNALVEVPSAGVRSIGYSRTMYSDRVEDGDVMIWYQKDDK